MFVAVDWLRGGKFMVIGTLTILEAICGKLGCSLNWSGDLLLSDALDPS
jgi:DNA-binding Xre family transcriptional regulator